MNIKQKLLMLMVGMSVSLIIIISSAYFSIKSSVANIEVEKAKANVASVKEYINSLVRAHGETYVSWTMWNEYYDAIVSKDKHWIDENVMVSINENTPNEVLIAIDNNGKILTEANAPKDWQGIDFKDFSLTKKLTGDTHYASGIFNTSDGLYIASMVQVSKSDDVDFKNTNGYTLYARKVTDKTVITGKDIMNVDITIKLDNGKVLTTNKDASNIAVNSVDLKDDRIVTNSETKSGAMVIGADQLFKDTDGKSIGVLHVETTSKSGVLALNKIFKYSMVFVLLILGFSVLILVGIDREIVVPIKKLMGATERIGRKDLSVEVKIKGKDEIAMLSGAFNKMVQNQREVMDKFLNAVNVVGGETEGIKGAIKELSSSAQGQANIIEEFTSTIENMDTEIRGLTGDMANLASNVSNVSSAIEEMGASVQDTAKNIDDAAAAINEVSASMEQMDESVKSISEHSKEAHLEAENTVNKAKEGNMAVNYTIQKIDKIAQAVAELSDAIRGLGDSAEKIGEIVNMIDDIADQTNLLSLNAAIEAARAGDAGKGFAVVANSIRVLAEKSSEATKEISGIVKGIQSEVKAAVEITNDSTQRVKEGVQYAKGTGQTFEDIFKAINKTSSLIQEIAASTEYQESGSKEMVKAIEKISELITQLSATAEQQAAGTDEIVRAVDKINNLMQQMSQSTQEQAAGSEEVVKLIQGINKGITEVSGGSEQIAQSTTQLAEQAQDLIKIIAQFKLN